MAAKAISSVILKRNRQGFMALLSSAACEWILIFMMFVDAALSYLLIKFALYCELQMPCLLCSRLDHIIENDKLGYYWTLLCSNHRAKISCLISCHIHDNLADVRGMCEECFMSIVMQDNCSSESYRKLVGKLGLDSERSSFHSAFSNKSSIPGSSITRICSCCNKSWKAKSNPQRLLHLTPVGFGASKANVKPPLPCVPGRSRFSRRDNLRRIRDKFSEPISPHHKGKTGADPLSHVGYSELRITSDSESEFPFSDDDDESCVVREKNNSKTYSVVQCGSKFMSKAQTDAPVDHTHQALSPDSSFIGPDFGEHNREQPVTKAIPSTLPELISLDDIPSSANVVEDPFGVSAERSKTDVYLSQMSSLHVLSELVALNNIPPQSNVVEAHLDASSEKSGDVTGRSDIGHKVVTEQVHSSESLSTTTEVPYAKVNEDLKLLPPLFSTRDTNLSLNTSPRPYGHHDVLHRSDAFRSDGVRVFQGSTSLERNDSGYESFEGSSVSEIEGESVVDRLKRQVEYDQRCLSSLYKELDEERSASAVAANQAMAMITRLQEDKAALHMEALQYLRMMEEQAEYDMEALEKANDLLAEKEKEMQDLEAELEFYRNNLSDEGEVENLQEETCNLKEENMTVGNDGVACIKSNANVHFDSRSTKISEGSDESINVQTPLLDFEEEKLYILQCLKSLESKFNQVSSNSTTSDMPNGVYSEIVTNEEVLSTNMGTCGDHQKEEYELSMQKDLSASNGDAHDGSEDNDFLCDKNNHFDSNWKTSSIHRGEIDMASLENEISDLHDRLEALEVDRDFLEHAFNSLKNGNEGLQFIQEIACQLQKLRKVRV